MDPVHDRGSMGPVHKVVHGPCPKWGSMDPWSMFCPHLDSSIAIGPHHQNNLSVELIHAVCHTDVHCTECMIS